MGISFDLVNAPLDKLEMSVRTYNALTANGVTTVGQLAELPKSEAMRFPNFGERSWREVADLQLYLRQHHGGADADARQLVVALNRFLRENDAYRVRSAPSERGIQLYKVL
jgi:hypothetical protein